eukprot:SAG31_NODE_1668_length_7576_cov_1.630467_1_plen_40_part_10
MSASALIGSSARVVPLASQQVVSESRKTLMQSTPQRGDVV